MTLMRVTTAGAGTMGSQVAWQMAYHGKQVTVYDAVPEGLERGKALHRLYAEQFAGRRGIDPDHIEATFGRLTYTTDLPSAVSEAQLVSESVPEALSIKEAFWREASEHAPADAILATNTSTLMPSLLAQFVTHPERFLALHFAIGVWDANIGEVMGHPDTDPQVFDLVVEFAREIGLVPIPIYKEQGGYIINSLLVPWCTAALDLLVRGVSDFESIDRTWMITLGTQLGPFGMIDRMGLGVVEHVAQLVGEAGDQTALLSAEYLDTEFLRMGHLGLSTGRGFYTYPDPAFTQPGFV